MLNLNGKLGEYEAARFLRKAGCEIIDTNFRTRHGEIDIIAKSGAYLLFVEVKARTVGSIGQPMEFVNFAKQNRIIATAQLFLMNNQLDLQPRFDVIEVFLKNNKCSKINHIKNAFELT